ncbi:MAG: hypothetical protein E7477_01765 [Ruminococcaceae bacterium]|nr:hypothetical protein [Oscillospiraceae bacterium]
MNFADRKDYGIAVRTGYGLYSPLCAGVKSYERKIKPIVKTFQYVSKRSTETEILGYTETISIKADRVIGDPANDYLFSLAEFTGTECKSEIFLFDRKEKGVSESSFIGRRYPVSVAVTRISGDDSGRTPFYGFEADIYINGEGIIEERAVN